MKTEKDIRKFFQDNKIPVPKDDAFMADLVRQIDLFQSQASLKSRSSDFGNTAGDVNTGDRAVIEKRSVRDLGHRIAVGIIHSHGVQP